MRIVLLLVITVVLFSCGSGDKPTEEQVKHGRSTVLRLPEIVSGMQIDTTLSSLRFNAYCLDGHSYSPGDVVLSGDSLTATVNIYADSSIESHFVDSVINLYCEGKDLRLIGICNGLELAIPFHTLHRFRVRNDTLKVWENEYHLFFVDGSNISVNDWPVHVEHASDYFRAFYGDPFNPLDSSVRFPQRKNNRQSIESLMLEGQAWDDADIRQSSDTALMLAAYNEFVNKLEVFDKVGSFCTFRLAVMEVDPSDGIRWGRMMRVLSEHYSVLHTLREEAKKYLSDKIANEGGSPGAEFTDEDLRLLYPDRLRWNGRISGVSEHRYDPDLLAEYYWVDPPEPVIVVPETSLDD